MQKLNMLGIEVLDLKNELSQEGVSPVVQKALSLMAEDMLKQKLIPMEVHYNLDKRDITEKDFESQLLEISDFKKTDSELREEFDRLTKEFSEEILFDKGDFVQVSTSSDIAKDRVTFSSVFRVDKEFVEQFFGVEDPEVADKMMERRGFVEKFIVFRFNRIMSNYMKEKPDYNEVRPEHELMEGVFLSPSISYFDENKGIFAIDFNIHCDISLIEEKSEEAYQMIQEETNQVIQYFKDRTQI